MFKVLSLSRNLESEKEKDREKEKVGDRPATRLNEKPESDRELDRKIKIKGYIFCWKNMKIL